VSLLDDLDAFSLEHRCCGDLDGGVDGDIVWFACTCGASRRGAWTRITAPAETDWTPYVVVSAIARCS
jgi:hypothetical protein